MSVCDDIFVEKEGEIMTVRTLDTDMNMNLHLFKRSDKFLGVEPSTRTYFFFEEEEWNTLKNRMNGTIMDPTHQELMQSIYSVVASESTFETQPEGRIYELVLMVSQDCNMKCSYCIADGGTYSREATFMDAETAKQGLEKICHLEDIKEIMFFGGEPFLNFPVIREIVELNRDEGRDIRHGVVTNGTIMTDKIIDFMKEHNMRLTVSLDGPSHIHNLCRVYRNGNGTHHRVVKTLEQLKEAGVPYGVEATYSKTILNEIPPKEVLAYLTQFSRHIKIDCVLEADCVDPGTVLTPEETYYAYREWADCVFEMWERGEPVDVRPISSIVWYLLSSKKLKSRTVCKAGGGRVTLFPEGDVYPCFAAYYPQYCMGNVLDEDFIKEYPENIKKIREKLSRDQVDCYWFSDLLSSVCVHHLKNLEAPYFTYIYPHLVEDIIAHLVDIEDLKTFQDVLRRSACGET